MLQDCTKRQFLDTRILYIYIGKTWGIIMGYLDISAINVCEKPSTVSSVTTTENQNVIFQNQNKVSGTKPQNTEKLVFKTNSKWCYDVFEFYPNGKIKSWTNAWSGDGEHIKNKYEYDEKGRVLKETFYDPSDDKQQKVAFTIVYNYENGKLVSQTYVEDNETYPVTKADIEHCNINSANKQLDYLLNNKRY